MGMLYTSSDISRGARRTGSETDLARAGENLRCSALRYATSARTLENSPRWTHRGGPPLPVLRRMERVCCGWGRHVIAPVSWVYRDGSRDHHSRASGPDETYDLWALTQIGKECCTMPSGFKSFTSGRDDFQDTRGSKDPWDERKLKKYFNKFNYLILLELDMHDFEFMQNC